MYVWQCIELKIYSYVLSDFKIDGGLEQYNMAIQS